MTQEVGVNKAVHALTISWLVNIIAWRRGRGFNYATIRTVFDIVAKLVSLEQYYPSLGRGGGVSEVSGHGRRFKKTTERART